MATLPVTPLYQTHPRGFEANRFVYPVVSRRAGGVSIGVNLNPEKFCNFDCVYCQVDRTEKGGPVIARRDLPQLEHELESMVESVISGRIFDEPQFAKTPDVLRRLNDIALSGDGEPTVSPVFEEAVGICADVRRRYSLDAAKLVLITNATYLDRASVRRGLQILDANNGEIWGKLDAGTDAYYHEIDRSKVSLRKVLDNLLATGRTRPIVIQTLFMQLQGVPPSEAELSAYCDRLVELSAGGCRIKLVQIHTIARRTAESFATPLSDLEVDAIVELVKQRTGLPVAGFYGRAA